MNKEEKVIHQIKKKLINLDALLPGAIKEQWNVCGTPGCRCKDPDKPQKHGPYYQLSFTVGGKGSTMFIKKKDLTEAKRRIMRHEKFKTLSTELVQAYIALARKNGIRRKSK